MTSLKPEPAGAQRVTWLLLLVAMLAAGWLVHRAKPAAVAGPSRFDFISAVPNGPELLVTADVESLGSAVAQELLRAGGGALLGLREQCGFEPILGLRRVAFAMPPHGHDERAGDFALIAETSFEAEAVLRCAETVIRKRGGNPVRSRLGAFASVRDQSKPLGEVAIRADGLFILSGGQYFRDVIDAAGGVSTGDAAARLRTQVHLRIRKQLAPSQLVVTLLPGTTLQLPGVQALGLGLELERELLLRGFVGCPSAAQCSDALGLAQRVRDDLARDPVTSGLASVKIVQRQAQLDISGHLPREQLAPLLAQLLAP